MLMRSRSWVVSLILLIVLLAAATWMGPDVSMASSHMSRLKTIKAAVLMDHSAVTSLAAILSGEPAKGLIDDTLALTLQPSDGVVDFESLVKIGEDDTPRGTFPRAIQTLTDPSLFARLNDDPFTEHGANRIESTIVPLPQESGSEMLVVLPTPSIGGHRFELATSAGLTATVAVPEPGTMTLIGAATLMVTAPLRARRARGGDRM